MVVLLLDFQYLMYVCCLPLLLLRTDQHGCYVHQMITVRSTSKGEEGGGTTEVVGECSASRDEESPPAGSPSILAEGGETAISNESGSLPERGEDKKGIVVKDTRKNKEDGEGTAPATRSDPPLSIRLACTPAKGRLVMVQTLARMVAEGTASDSRVKAVM